MPRRLPLRRALVATLVIAALGTPVAAMAATASELAVARERIDRTSAELAQARTAAEGLGGAEREALDRLERRLMRQKQALVALESGLAARHAQESAAADPAPADADTPDAPARLSTSASAGPDGPLVVLADPPPEKDAPATPGPTVVPLPDERRPPVAGDDAGLAARLDAYLASRASPLTGLGAVFVTESRAEDLDPRLLVAISGAETSFGTYGPSQGIHNPFGMGPGIVYPSWSDAIRSAARNLGGNLYAGSGLFTIPAIQGRWAPNGATNDPTGLNNNWVRNVSAYYSELGGDPTAAVMTATGATPSPAAVTTAAPGGPAGAPVVVPAAPVIAAPAATGASGEGAAAAQSALARLGTRSVRGGQTPRRGFDAAGLVVWAYAEHGVTVPRGVVAQSRVGTEVEPADLEAGDAVFFSDPSGLVERVGLYVGGGQFVHAPGPGETVGIASLYEPYHAEAFAGARRY